MILRPRAEALPEHSRIIPGGGIGATRSGTGACE